jgi:hypothetical protein
MELIFSTFNARYSHTALALRCLRANLGVLHEQSAIVEFDIRLAPFTAAERLLEQDPKIILFSVYIWNIDIISETVTVLRSIAPHVKIIIGGPEVSYEYEDLSLFKNADVLIRGEGEEVIENICCELLADKMISKVIEGPPADMKRIHLPYSEYTDEDIAHRRIYVETTRGCPSKCQYCLSSLEHGVRSVPLDIILPQFKTLIERGARIFKFIDRSFNINPSHASEIIRFFLKNRCDGMMLHLEWEPHLLPPELLELLKEAPDGFFQLEVGVQTFTQDVANRIDRRLDEQKVIANISTLSALPSLHLHADLIAGLPGETIQSLEDSFNQLHACTPHEIQLGILKKLRGAPIAQHNTNFEMVYHTAPPYDVLQTSTLSFSEIQSIRRFARFLDITVNNGRFPNTSPLIWKDQPSVFAAFLEWSNWLFEETHATSGFTPGRLGRLLKRFLTEQRSLNAQTVSLAIDSDLNRTTVETKGMERQSRK